MIEEYPNLEKVKKIIDFMIKTLKNENENPHFRDILFSLSFLNAFFIDTYASVDKQQEIAELLHKKVCSILDKKALT